MPRVEARPGPSVLAVVPGDQELTCRDCGEPFVFTASGQTWFAAHTPPWPKPTRCVNCRTARRLVQQSRQDVGNLPRSNDWRRAEQR